jgi:hypothetical protein
VASEVTREGYKGIIFAVKITMKVAGREKFS